MNRWVKNAKRFVQASTITGIISISAFTSLLGSPIGITSSAKGLKICAIAVEIKEYKPVIKKKKKKHDKIVLLAKSKLNNIELLISKVLIDSNTSHNEFVFRNNKLKEYERRSQKFKEFTEDLSLSTKQCYHIVWSVEKTQKVKIQNL